MEKQQVQYNFHERVVHGNLLYFYLYVNLFTFFGKRLDNIYTIFTLQVKVKIYIYFTGKSKNS